MKHETKAHQRHGRVEFKHTEPAPAQDNPFAALLAAPVGGVAAHEPSLFDGLLAGPLKSGKRRRLVVCSECGDPGCSWSRYVDE